MAIDYFTRCISLDSTNKLAVMDFLYERAVANAKCRLFARATSDCSKIIEIRGSIAPVADKYWSHSLRAILMQRALFYRESQQFVESITDFKSVLALEESSQTRKDLELVYREFRQSNRLMYSSFTLGVDAETPFDDIRRKYRQLILKFHPDKCKDGDKDANTEQTKLIIDAYQFFEEQ